MLAKSGLSPVPLSVAEQVGLKFSKSIGASSLADLRAIPADKLLNMTASTSFPTTIDNHFLVEYPLTVYEKGNQIKVPLLSGWNSAEVEYHSLLGRDEPTLTNYKKVVKQLYNEHAGDVLRLYHAETDADVPKVATDLAADRFIVYNTWKFIDVHSRTSGSAVYRYLFSRKRPPYKDIGAPHASEIDYAFGNLRYNKFFNWTSVDYEVSSSMLLYFVNFIKIGNPNGQGLAFWSKLQNKPPKVMDIDENIQSRPEKNRARYLLLDSLESKMNNKI
ncbi:carboxylesterase [Acrasis kona]|uniref:Carboxylesterase n=1 Tax=Acrasis kona TaxID=1008807 RepID=A0AAW2YKH3_9EUKA